MFILLLLYYWLLISALKGPSLGQYLQQQKLSFIANICLMMAF